METITEGKASIKAPVGETISKDLEVFYNPLMKLNRDVSLLLLKALDRKDLIISDPLAGTGIRSLRMLSELPCEMIKEIRCNDLHRDFPKFWEENAALSKISSDKVSLSQQEASLFLLTHSSADYIDIDPFGSPNVFLDAAIKRLRREGILAVTATDTAPLCGTYPLACQRKYWATPRRDEMMHEAGLRILIRKCQLVAAQYDCALIPIISYSKDHYFRVFFRASRGKKKVDLLLAQHGMWESAGPLWTGDLLDNTLLESMKELSTEEECHDFISLLAQESSVSALGFIDLHALSRKLKLPSPPKTSDAIALLSDKGYKAVRTHIMGMGVRTTASEKELGALLLK